MPIQFKEPLELLEGYSVAKATPHEGFYVYRNGEEYCAYIKMITSLSGWTMPAFNWHDSKMWNFRASDFVRNVP